MNTTDLVIFNPTEVAAFGNKFLNAIVAHELVKEEAEQVLAEAEQRESFIDFELTRAAMYLDSEKKISVHEIFGDKKDSEKLYRQILIELGVMSRTITDDDKVIYDFTDGNLRGQFYFGTDEAEKLTKQFRKDGLDEDTAKAKSEAEMKRRRSRRNSLNIRMARVCKASVALVDAKATVNDLVYQEDATTGEQVPVIRKGPKEVMGTGKEPVRVHTKAAAKAEGASIMPTLGGLAKVAEGKHKKADAVGSADGRTGDAKGSTPGIVDESDFLALSNTMLMTIKNREGQFSDAERAALKNLLTLLEESGIN